MIPRISVDEAIDSDLDSGSSRQVLQRVDPVSVHLGLFHDHLRSVAYGIRCVKGGTGCFLWGRTVRCMGWFGVMVSD